MIVAMTTNHGYVQPRLFEVDPIPATQWVYALLMPSQAVKIGWTRRTPEVRAGELGGRLLASRPGGHADERALHDALAPYRIGRTEDFWPAPSVWRTVDAMRVAA